MIKEFRFISDLINLNLINQGFIVSSIKIELIMKIKNFKILFFLFFLSNFLVAQNPDFENVTIQELEEKSHPKDTSAVAAVLYNKAKTNFLNSNVHQTEYTIRIKIYKKEGLSKANFEVPFYVGYKNINSDSVKFSDCVTYNLVNGKIDITKLSNEGTFNENINSYWSKSTITMPNVKVGSIIEIKYFLRSENNLNLPKFYFQFEIPCNFSQYVTQVPDYYIYNVVLNGYLELNTDASSNKLSNSVKSIYTIHNAPALKAEKYVDNIDNYRSSLEHELKSTRYLNKYSNVAVTWEGVAKIINKHDAFGKELSKRNYFETEFNGKLVEPSADIKRMEEVLKYVQNRMNWNGVYGYYSDKGVNIAFANQAGNVADINFILITLLNYSGFKASPVLLSTRDNGLALFPSRTRLNYVIAGVELGDEIYLLDATDKYSQIDVLPFRDLNRVGRLVRNDDTVTDVLLNPKSISKFITMINGELTTSGLIKGQLKSFATDYYANSLRNRNNDLSFEMLVEQREKSYPAIQISNYELENQKDISKSLSENYDFEHTNSIEIIDDKIYLNPLLFLTEMYNPFINENREYPINFGFPFQKKQTFNLTIPDGYEVESLPKNINLAIENNLGGFKYMIQNTGNKIQLVVTTEILKPEIGINNYESFRAFYQKMFEKQLEKVILKKK